MKKMIHNVRRIVLATLVLVFAIAPLLASPPVAHAATTTTKYLNGKIVFDSDRSGNNEIYTINPDGSNVIKLTVNNSTGDFNATWSPDGNKIAFVTYRDGSNDIYTMNADGSNQTRLTSNPTLDDRPSWSPDGSKIVFYSNRDWDGVGPYISEIYTMNADGSNQTRLTNHSSSDTFPAWSLANNKIAFVSRHDGNAEIYTMNADGSNQTRITNNVYGDYVPAWSADGTKISFVSDRDSPPSPYSQDIYTMNADGTNIARVTNTVAVEDGISYSSDGTKLLSTIYPDENYNSSEVFVMNLDGTERTQLTNGGGYDENYGSQSWQPLPYTQTTNDNNTITSTIPSTANYSSTDYTVVSGETLVLDGSLCDVTVQSGGTLIGTGSIAPDCTLTVESGGVVNPGHSPGCLASGNTTLSGTYQAELAGTTACTQYDQLQVTGTVNLTNSTLTPSLLNGFVPKAGDSFTIIQNDSTDPVISTFANLPEGSTITIGTTVFKISYVGNDGNDVTLTALPGSPNTGYSLQSNMIMVISGITAVVLGIGAITHHRKLLTQKMQ